MSPTAVEHTGLALETVTAGMSRSIPDVVTALFARPIRTRPNGRD
jgi:hypothetical protein